MSAPIASNARPDFHAFTEIIDVRSPAEFAEDHVPGAINLPVLDNEERAQVGTIYKQQSPFQARKLGAALVAANIAKAVREHFIDKPRDYRPLVYCWRGGQRSMSLATILARIGWPTTVIEGGYKQYRKQVIETLETIPPKLRLIVVSGLTGTAKTDFLKALQQAGEQIIDLEGLARHRGSLLGPDPEGPQPAQKYFESLLARTIRQLNPERPVWIEAESNKIGNLHCPAALWKQMGQAQTIELRAPRASRVEYLLGQYDHFLRQPDALKEKISALRFRHGAKQVETWLDMIDHGAWRDFVANLLEVHYDPAYSRAIRKNRAEAALVIELQSLTPQALHEAALTAVQAIGARQQ
ncbi:MAG TPA: tRNA 2-selenouridine(34) synthase MnmH [Gammaproteobacteria bacterium]|nr:tRNA 2-selenouridine(34) synthase MnmH [Gammaproteobacteria bacterium]